MRKLLIALVAVVVAVAVAIGWWPARELTLEPLAKSGGERTADLSLLEDARPLAVEAERQVDPATATPADGSRSGVVGTSSSGALQPKPVATPGRIVLRDADDREIEAGSGTLSGFWMAESDAIGTDSIPVVDGRFAVVIPEGRTLQPMRLELDGELVLLKRVASSLPGLRTFIVPDATGEVVIEAKRMRTLRLHVLDAATHAELSSVSVVESPDSLLDDVAHPGSPRADNLLADQQPSPITLALLPDDVHAEWTMSLHVGAAGHAWSQVEVDAARGLEVTVELAPGGTIDATISGDLPRDLPSQRRMFDDMEGRTVLRVRQPYAPDPDEESDEVSPEGVAPSRLVAELLPAAEGPTRIDGLAPGRYFVTLEQGDHWSNPRRFARADVEVRAGATALAQLVVRADDRPATVPLRGRVRISPTWGELAIDLHFEPIRVPGACSADEFEINVRTRGSAAGPEWHPFDAGTCLPGRWLVTSYGIDLQQVVDTGPSGRSDVEIVFGDPADVVVRLLDDSTGTTIAVDDQRALVWHGARPEESTGGNLVDTLWDEELGAWCFRAPAGEIGMLLWGEAKHLFEGLDDVSVRIEPGHNEFTYRLRRLQSLEVRFEIGGLSMPEDHSLEAISFIKARAVSVASGATADLKSWGFSSIWFRLPDPGRWRVEVAPIEGYRPIAPFEVDVPARKRTVHRVALVRDDG